MSAPVLVLRPGLTAVPALDCTPLLSGAQPAAYAVSVATHARSSPGLWLSEVVATFGLVLVVVGVAAAMWSCRHETADAGGYQVEPG